MTAGSKLSFPEGCGVETKDARFLGGGSRGPGRGLDLQWRHCLCPVTGKTPTSVFLCIFYFFLSLAFFPFLRAPLTATGRNQRCFENLYLGGFRVQFQVAANEFSFTASK